ncbi:membrane protein [Aliidongia dinghuensis]|uniref:Membrane protein n=1 Tax=Aliidongia dinghuensis TaxID=1867774 RepID=A0A8J3E2U4_9PROT|nr:DMT family transporter [Aliidongia dinghuensis]GGF24469.1 membrane protein [Aliidongia dinghuensis]
MTKTSHGPLAWPGAPLALGSAVLFGASTPLAKLLLGAVDPWLLAGLLYLGSGAGLAFVHFGRRSLGIAPPETSLTRADLPWLAAVVVAGGAIGPVLLMVGLSTTPASSAALLLNLEGLATMGIAWLAFHENADRRILMGAAAILVGALLLSWQGAPSGSGSSGIGWGALAIMGACLAWGIDNNLTRRLSSADPVQIAMTKGLAAGAANLALALWHGAALPPAGPALSAAVVGFFGYGVSLVMFVLGLRHLGAARTGAYFSLAPFVGAVLGLVLFGEPLTARLLGAAVLMGFGLYLHLVEHHDHEHEHAELVHDHVHVHDEHHQHAHEPGTPAGEPHAHMHRHAPMIHRHPHYPDLHHRHAHPH